MAVDTIKRNRRQNAWQKENADRINFVMPKGYKQMINDAAQEMGMSASEFIREAIREKLERNHGGLQSSADEVK